MLTVYYPDYSEIRGNSHLFLMNPLAKVGLSVKFGVAVFKASMLDSLGGSIGQSRFICQVWCSSIQGIFAQFTGGSICQSMFICQVWCTSIQGKYHLSELKSLIVFWGVFWGVSGGVK